MAQRRQIRVAPRVRRDLVAVGVLALEDGGEGRGRVIDLALVVVDSRHEEGCLGVVLGQQVEGSLVYSPGPSS